MLKINKNPNPKELRQFGWTLIVGFAILGALLYWRGKISVAYGFWGIGMPLGLLSVLVMPAAKILYRVWTTWGYFMGTVVTRVILVVLFFGVITPVGLLFRLFGRDILQLKRDEKASSYWTDHRRITLRTYYDRLF